MKALKVKPKEWTEAKVTDLLAARYKGNAWAFLPKVRNGTGWAREARTADAVAMSLWPSRGLHVYGFEIKVERSDWLRELNDPQKAEDIFAFCDFWFVVAAPNVVKVEELPKTWGLLEVAGSTLRATVDAPALSPAPVDRLFLASLLRKVTENMAAEQQLTAARKRGRDEGFEEGQQQAKREVEYADEKRLTAEKIVTEFEEQTGLRFSTWRPVSDMANAVNAVLRGEDGRIMDKLKRIRGDLSDLLAEVDKTVGKKD